MTIYFNTHELFKEMIKKNIDMIGTFGVNCIPREVYQVGKEFYIENKKRIVNNDRSIYCPSKVILCKGVYYIFIVDNNFCMATNNVKYINCGKNG